MFMNFIVVEFIQIKSNDLHCFINVKSFIDQFKASKDEIFK